MNPSPATHANSTLVEAAMKKYVLYMIDANAGSAPWCPCWVFEHTACEEPHCTCPRFCGLRLEAR